MNGSYVIGVGEEELLTAAEDGDICAFGCGKGTGDGGADAEFATCYDGCFYGEIEVSTNGIDGGISVGVPGPGCRRPGERGHGWETLAGLDSGCEICLTAERWRNEI